MYSKRENHNESSLVTRMLQAGSIFTRIFRLSVSILTLLVLLTGGFFVGQNTAQADATNCNLDLAVGQPTTLTPSPITTTGDALRVKITYQVSSTTFSNCAVIPAFQLVVKSATTGIFSSVLYRSPFVNLGTEAGSKFVFTHEVPISSILKAADKNETELLVSVGVPGPTDIGQPNLPLVTPQVNPFKIPVSLTNVSEFGLFKVSDIQNKIKYTGVAKEYRLVKDDPKPVVMKFDLKWDKSLGDKYPQPGSKVLVRDDKDERLYEGLYGGINYKLDAGVAQLECGSIVPITDPSKRCTIARADSNVPGSQSIVLDPAKLGFDSGSFDANGEAAKGYTFLAVLDFQEGGIRYFGSRDYALAGGNNEFTIRMYLTEAKRKEACIADYKANKPDVSDADAAKYCEDPENSSHSFQSISGSVSDAGGDAKKAGGDPLAAFVAQVVGYVVLAANQLLFWVFYNLVAPLLEALLSIRTYTDAFVGVIYPGWELLRNLGNIFFILILVVIGLTTLFRIEGYQYKDLLVKLVIGAVLINFSLIVGQSVLAVADTVQNQFLPNNVTVIRSLANELMVKPIQRQSYTPPINTADSFALIISPIFFLALALGSFLTLGAIAIFLVIRMAMLWILLMLSPVPYVAMILPQTRNMANAWWDTFLRYAFFTPIMAFFLNIAAIIANKYPDVIRQISIDNQVSGVTNSPIQEFFFKATSTIVVLVFLGLALQVADKFSIYGSSAITGAVRRYTKAGSVGLVAAGATLAGARALEGASNLSGVQLNPFKIAQGVKKSFNDAAIAREDRLKSGQSGLLGKFAQSNNRILRGIGQAGVNDFEKFSNNYLGFGAVKRGLLTAGGLVGAATQDNILGVRASQLNNLLTDDQVAARSAPLQDALERSNFGQSIPLPQNNEAIRGNIGRELAGISGERAKFENEIARLKELVSTDAADPEKVQEYQDEIVENQNALALFERANQNREVELKNLQAAFTAAGDQPLASNSDLLRNAGLLGVLGAGIAVPLKLSLQDGESIDGQIKDKIKKAEEQLEKIEPRRAQYSDMIDREADPEERKKLVARKKELDKKVDEILEEKNRYTDIQNKFDPIIKTARVSGERSFNLPDAFVSDPNVKKEGVVNEEGIRQRGRVEAQSIQDELEQNQKARAAVGSGFSGVRVGKIPEKVDQRVIDELKKKQAASAARATNIARPSPSAPVDDVAALEVGKSQAEKKFNATDPKILKDFNKGMEAFRIAMNKGKDGMKEAALLMENFASNGKFLELLKEFNVDKGGYQALEELRAKLIDRFKFSDQQVNALMASMMKENEAKGLYTLSAPTNKVGKKIIFANDAQYQNNLTKLINKQSLTDLAGWHISNFGTQKKKSDGTTQLTIENAGKTILSQFNSPAGVEALKKMPRSNAAELRDATNFTASQAVSDQIRKAARGA